MTEFSVKFQEARERLREPVWSDARADKVWQGIQERQRRFAFGAVALGSAALAVAVAVAIVWFAQGGSRSQDTQLANRPLELRDGTRAVALGPQSSVRLLEEDTAHVSFVVDSGKGWFEVTPSATREVVVRAADVRVVVLGTEFVVEVDGELVHVWVRRGRVRVRSGETTVELREGQDRGFPAHDPKPEPIIDIDASVPAVTENNTDEPSPATVAPMPPATPKKSTHTPPTAAERMPSEASVPSSEEQVGELWRRADSARLRGDNKGAISALTTLLSHHRDDPRAPLAAFTLGLVLVDSEGSMATAARAFAMARKLAPQGPLVEDALLREIEAWYEASDDRRVESRSKKYLRMFPKGRYRIQIEELRSSP